MPVSVVKSRADESRWAKAKEQARKAGHENDWPYVMSIYKKLEGNSEKAAAIRLAMACGARQIHETNKLGRHT
jgi:hypothetical protein